MILILTFITLGFFYYAYSNKIQYSNERKETSQKLVAYSLLISCLSFIALAIYLQFKYKFFENNYGIASFIPSAIFIILAYYFDHIGVLSLGLTGITSWIGLAINPSELLQPFSNDRMVTNASIFLGVALILAAYFLEGKNIKKHFTFTYYNFAAMNLFPYSFSGIIYDEYKFIYFIVLILSSIFFLKYAQKEKSKYFYIISIICLVAGFCIYFFNNRWYHTSRV
jgi:hypothetical protein